LFGGGKIGMCTILRLSIVGPRIDDCEILSAVRSFGFQAEDDRVWRQGDREAVFYVDGYLAHGEETCLCPLGADPDGQARLRGLLEFLLARCTELYYAPEISGIEEEPAQEIAPAAVHTTHWPGEVAPWGRVKMPEHFSRGLAHLSRMMRDAGVEVSLDYSGGFRFRVSGLGIEVCGREEEEVARELLAVLTWLWAEYGMAAEEALSADALEARRKVLALVKAGII
jgi:hypothetical protein